MKYIRTKDGIYVAYIDKNTTLEEVNLAYKEDKAIDIADTIKELCDVFVAWVENESQTPVCVSLCDDTKRAYELTKEGILLYMADGVECWLKLGIWVESGMRYVAKMNEKGDFELL